MISQTRLKELVKYDENTGKFYYTDNGYHPRQKYGKQAGTYSGRFRGDTSNVYLAINLDAKTYLLHQLAFLYMTGRFPKEQIDHVNGNKLDNSWKNLREVTRQQNAWNYPRPVTNTSGIKGLYLRKSHGLYGYQIRVMKDNRAFTKSFSINDYAGDWEKTKEAAAEYLKYLRIQLHGEFARHD